MSAKKIWATYGTRFVAHIVMAAIWWCRILSGFRIFCIYALIICKWSLWVESWNYVTYTELWSAADPYVANFTGFETTGTGYIKTPKLQWPTCIYVLIRFGYAFRRVFSTCKTYNWRGPHRKARQKFSPIRIFLWELTILILRYDKSWFDLITSSTVLGTILLTWHQTGTK